MAPEEKPPVDPQRCPLCGKANECGMESGKGTCWCFTRSIPESVIEQIPAEARDQACVCGSCASAGRDSPVERTNDLDKSPQSPGG